VEALGRQAGLALLPGSARQAAADAAAAAARA
jgi:hypothetical protein